MVLKNFHLFSHPFALGRFFWRRMRNLGRGMCYTRLPLSRLPVNSFALAHQCPSNAKAADGGSKGVDRRMQNSRIENAPLALGLCIYNRCVWQGWRRSCAYIIDVWGRGAVRTPKGPDGRGGLTGLRVEGVVALMCHEWPLEGWRWGTIGFRFRLFGGCRRRRRPAGAPLCPTLSASRGW